MDYIRDNKNKPYKYKKPFDYCANIHLTNIKLKCQKGKEFMKSSYLKFLLKKL